MSTYNFEKIARRDFLRSLGLGAAALAVPGCLNGAVQKQGHSSSKLPNVVIIFTDDQGYQDVGCFGSPLIKTPNLDRMACEGVKFTDMHVA
ncbi:MAG: sulfatase-like hydrolase/transferase, partial [Sedimentisphaerales bacterium]|nr:sulfatase-like hydrolase/transferase [Sedimentisphaerales bacterium]